VGLVLLGTQTSAARSVEAGKFQKIGLPFDFDVINYAHRAASPLWVVESALLGGWSKQALCSD
jgi:hypothetical protein